MAAPSPSVLAELYAVPPGAFTRERDARAAALAKAGRAEEARAVKQLRRPSASLWAINQLARLDARGLAAFLDAVDRIRATQFRDPAAAAAASKEHRTHLAALVRRAGQALTAEGHRPTPTLERRISDTLLGAAVDRALADALRHGRLAAEVQAPGFEALMGTPGGGRLRLVIGGKTTPHEATAPAKKDEERRRQQAEAREQEAARLEAEATALEREADARGAAVSQLEREVEAASAALADKRRALREAQREAKRATTAARKARRAARWR